MVEKRAAKYELIWDESQILRDRVVSAWATIARRRTAMEVETNNKEERNA